jgi:hypothetical protein
MRLASGARSRFFTELTSPASFFSDHSRVQVAKTASSAKDIEQVRKSACQRNCRTPAPPVSDGTPLQSASRALLLAIGVVSATAQT